MGRLIILKLQDFVNTFATAVFLKMFELSKKSLDALCKLTHSFPMHPWKWWKRNGALGTNGLNLYYIVQKIPWSFYGCLYVLSIYLLCSGGKKQGIVD